MSDQEQETVRLIPTRPGWWWRGGDYRPRQALVARHPRTGSLTWSWGFDLLTNYPVTDDGSWLAEVPDPATCAAWVAAGRPGPEVLGCLPTLTELAEAAERDKKLVENAVRVAVGVRRRGPAWVRVGNAFALGSTAATQLCRRFGYDPDTGKRVEVAKGGHP